MDKYIYIGIDPGKNGGIVGLYDDEVFQERCPKEPLYMYNALCSMVENFKYSAPNREEDKVRVFIEHVHAFPKQGVVSTFSFGQNYGQWEGIISSFKIEPTIVSPQKWMKFYNTPKGLTRKDRKRFLIDRARKLFGGEKITFNVSDAFLIANYNRQQYYEECVKESKRCEG